MSLSRYRAWDKENDRMIYPSTEGVCFEMTDDGIDVLDVTDYPDDHVFPRIDSVLMQSTDIKDKNGAEIYEGDILVYTSKSINYGDTYYHSYVEVFRNQSGAYRIRGEHIYETELYSNRNSLVVVGDIYSSPELLKKERFMTSTADPGLEWSE